MWVFVMMKEINFPCSQCSHCDVCIHVPNMKVLDEQLKECNADVPYAKLNVSCSKFISKEQTFKR